MRKNIKRLTKCFCALAVALCIGVPAIAATFTDVPSNHWAYSAISKMADAGFMVGDSSGKYYPNTLIDRFYAAKILAKAGGYKTVGFTAAEKTYQDSAYEANKSTLSVFKKNFTKWDSSAERELSYLLEKQVFTVDDLNKIVTKNNGVETIRNLTKEDAALYLVRLTNKNNAALSVNPASWALFSDDSQISSYNRPYIYYMKSQSMITGDASNRFNPKTDVSKAVFATMLNNALASVNLSLSSQNVNRVESTSGTIVEVYSARSAIQVSDYSGVRSIHNIALGTQITIDGFIRTVADLQSGMTFTAVLVNDELTNIKAATTATITTPAAETTPAPAMTLSVIEGTVSGISADAVAPTISIDVRMLNTVGTIYNETRTLKPTSDCKVTRGGTAIEFSAIGIGDIVSAQVSGSSVYWIEARQAQMSFPGVLKEKKVNNVTNYYVIEDLSGKQYEFIVNDETVIERAPNETGLKWNDIRLGDKVDVKTNYNVITYIRGEGTRTNVEGTVKEVHIYENNLASVVFQDSQTRATKEYPLVSSIVDVYSIRVGDKLRLRLDSLEIDSYTKLENSSVLNITGKLTSLRSSYFVITPANSNIGTQIHFDNNTYVYDTISRKSSSPSNLGQNMELFVTYQPGATNYASSITILSR